MYKLTEYKKVTRQATRKELMALINDVRIYQDKEVCLYALNPLNRVYQFRVCSIPYENIMEDMDQEELLDYCRTKIPKDLHIDLT